VSVREEKTNCRRFDDTRGTRKHRATEVFSERYGQSALFRLVFLRNANLDSTESIVRLARRDCDFKKWIAQEAP
jgi:hypothetical protein